MTKRKIGLLAALAVLAVSLLVVPAASTTLDPAGADNAGLSLYDQALKAHTSLEPVLRGQRIQGGENFVEGDLPALGASTTTSTALAAQPTPNVTQNGVCNDQKPEAQVGETRTFWVHNFKLMADVQKPFILAAKTEHVYFWVDLTQYGTLVDDALALEAAQEFESIYTTDRAYFGREAQCDELPHRQPPRLEGIWGTPWYDADDDRHINIVNFDPDVGATVVAGYYSSADEYPKTVNEHSNEGEFFYMNSLMFAPASDTYTSILAHEFYHMIQFANDANEESWVNEGMADVAIEVNGFGALTASHTSDYANTPEDQLTHWDGELYDYGNAYSFFSYFLEHYGPADDPATPFKENYALAEQITKVERDGLAGVDDVLTANPHKSGLAGTYQDDTAEDVYLNRAVANVLNDRSLEDGQYGYGQLSAFAVNPHGAFDTYPQSEDGNATVLDPALGRVYGDRIYAFDSAADGTFSIEADAQVPIVDNKPVPSGTHQLWGNRVDESVTFAERAADLSGTSAPHLHFSYWYDIELDYDYAYLRVSDDGGQTWDNLACCGSSSTDPNGNNHGNGITGTSGGALGPSWQTADVDLTAYAGKQVLVRFEYVTDPAVNNPGFTVDDVSLVDGANTIWPLATFESGLDGFEVGGNAAATFLRVESDLPNELVLQLVKVGHGVEVSRHNATASAGGVSASGSMGAFRTYAIFTSLTPITSEHFGYEWTANASPPTDPTPPVLTATGGASQVGLSWTQAGNAGALSPSQYLIQESNAYAKPIDDDAESGLGSTWISETTGTGATGFSTSTAKSNSPDQSFWGSAAEGATDAASILRYNGTITIPTGGKTLLTFYDWHINESDDSVNIDVRAAGATDWTTVYQSGRSALPDESGPALATEPMSPRKVDLAAYKGQTVELRFRFQAGSANRAGSQPLGWYLDDIKLESESWVDVATVSGSQTSYTVSKSAAGTFFYRVAALYTPVALGPWSNVDNAVVTAPQSEFQLGSAAYSVSEWARKGQPATVTVTVTRSGSTAGTASVAYATQNGTAQAGSDYQAKSGTLSFAAGETGKTIVLTVIDDKVKEGNETFTLALSSPVGGTLGAPSETAITIVDNDKESGKGK